MRRLVTLSLLALIWTLPLAAEVDPYLLSNLDNPVLDLDILDAEEKEELRSTFAQHWKNIKDPTLRELIQTPRSILYNLNEKDQSDNPFWGPMHRLQRGLAVRGFSLEMDDQHISRLSQIPESVLYRALEEMEFPLRIRRPFYHLGLFTIYDLFKGFPDSNHLDIFLKQWMKEKEIHRTLKISPKGADLIRELYQKAMSEWQLEKEKGAVQGMEPRFAALFSNDLVEVLINGGVVNQEKLYKSSDSQLKDLPGMNLRLISELYQAMEKLEIYESPERCNGVFQG